MGTWLLHRCGPEQWIGIACGLTVIVAALTLSTNVTRATKLVLGTHSLLGKINEHLNPFRSRHALVQCGLPVYDLKIKPSEYRSVLEIVEVSKARGRLTDDLKQWARAKFIFQGIAHDVKVRVRGDGAEHWAHDRRSWRIRFRKDDPFGGCREINLIVMADGKSISGPFANAVFRRLGMTVLRDRYAVLRINGIPQGIYYESEHFDAPMLAYNDRPETTLFRNPGGSVDLGSFRDMIAKDQEPAWSALNVLLTYETDPDTQKLQAACGVTDMEDYLRFLAGVTLFSADHTSFVTDNHRLHYDTSEGVFRRVPWDLEPQRIPKLERFELADWHATFDVFARWPMSHFHVAVLQDNELRLRRNQVLWELVRDDSLLSLFDETYRGLDFAFWTDVAGSGDEAHRIARFRELVRHNLNHIRKSLDSNRASLIVQPESSHLTRLEFVVDMVGGIDVNQIELPDSHEGVYTLYRDLNGDGRFDGAADPALQEVMVGADGLLVFDKPMSTLSSSVGVARDYPAYYYDPAGGGTPYRSETLKSVVYPVAARHRFFLKRESKACENSEAMPTLVHVRARNAVTGKWLGDQEFPIRHISSLHEFNPQDRVRSLDEFLEAHSQFVADDGPGGRGVVLPAGRHRFAGSTIIPNGVPLSIEAGTVLEMEPQASILCFGPIHAEGTANRPIEIGPVGPEPWGVIASVRSEQESIFRHVHVTGGNTLAGVTVLGIYFTAALAVHGGDVFVEHCRIHDNPAEDGLNIKHGHVRLRNSEFLGNQSDGVDLDWVTGEVVGCRFSRNNGDALDLSGSRVTIRDNRMEFSGDKGISVGERSRPDIFDNAILGNAIGIAVKDLSEARIERCTLMGNDVSIAAYRKKPVFGGGIATLQNCVFRNTTKLLDVDRFSSVSLEDCIGPAQPNVPGLKPAPDQEQAQNRSADDGHDPDSAGLRLADTADPTR